MDAPLAAPGPADAEPADDGPPALAVVDASSWRCVGHEAVRLRWVSAAADMDAAAACFAPSMSHQWFGAEETIYGFRDLAINIFVRADTLETYMTAKFAEATTDADDIYKALMQWMAPPRFKTRAEFVESLRDGEASSWTPPGEKLSQWTAGCGKTFVCYMASFEDTRMVAYYRHLKALPMWFIDGASVLEEDDGRWVFFLAYELRTLESGVRRFSLAAFTTCYRFWAYPHQHRLRISQFLVLPIYRRAALGRSLMNVVYRHAEASPDIVDVTVEDPAPEFVRLRDLVDIERLSEDGAPFAAAHVPAQLTPALIEEIRKKTKRTKGQIRRCWELQTMRAVRTSQQYEEFRLMVKRRIFRENQLGRPPVMGPAGSSANFLLIPAMAPPLPEDALQTIEQENKKLLQDEWEAVERHYQLLIARLASADRYL